MKSIEQAFVEDVYTGIVNDDGFASIKAWDKYGGKLLLFYHDYWQLSSLDSVINYNNTFLFVWFMVNAKIHCDQVSFLKFLISSHGCYYIDRSIKHNPPLFAAILKYTTDQLIKDCQLEAQSDPELKRLIEAYREKYKENDAECKFEEFNELQRQEFDSTMQELRENPNYLTDLLAQEMKAAEDRRPKTIIEKVTGWWSAWSNGYHSVNGEAKKHDPKVR